MSVTSTFSSLNVVQETMPLLLRKDCAFWNGYVLNSLAVCFIARTQVLAKFGDF